MELLNRSKTNFVERPIKVLQFGEGGFLRAFVDYMIDIANEKGKFEIEPLERGFGNTIGNALRRTMLSSLPGGAVYSIKIDGIFHEFSSIKGVREDTTLIVLNIKSLILDIADDDIYTLRISAKGPCTVKAEDIILPAGVEILNPELEIAHLDKGGELEMELLARKGRGYVCRKKSCGRSR